MRPFLIADSRHQPCRVKTAATTIEQLGFVALLGNPTMTQNEFVRNLQKCGVQLEHGENVGRLMSRSRSSGLDYETTMIGQSRSPDQHYHMDFHYVTGLPPDIRRQVELVSQDKQALDANIGWMHSQMAGCVQFVNRLKTANEREDAFAMIEALDNEVAAGRLHATLLGLVCSIRLGVTSIQILSRSSLNARVLHLLGRCSHASEVMNVRSIH